jgi:hypothetical protein
VAAAPLGVPPGPSLGVVSSGGGGWALAARVEDEFFISFLIISQKYRTV